MSPFPPNPFAQVHPAFTSPSLWPSPHCCLCLWILHKCSLANPFSFFHPVPLPLPSDSCQGVPGPHASVSSLSVYFAHYIPPVSEIMWYSSLTDWLISLSIIIFRLIHAVEKVRLPLFLQPRRIPLCKCAAGVFNPVIYWWALGLFPFRLL